MQHTEHMLKVLSGSMVSSNFRHVFMGKASFERREGQMYECRVEVGRTLPCGKLSLVKRLIEDND